MSSARVVPVSFYTGSKIIKNFLNINSHTLNRYTVASTNVRSIWQRANKTSPEESKNIEPEPEAGDTKNTTDTENPIKLEVEQLNKTIAELKEQNETLNDKYKRALADGENLRIRLTKQIEDAKIFGIQGFCKDLLEVADILAKATECVPKDEISDDNPHLKNLYEGLTMTETQLKKVFIRHGLVPINPLDEKFNPNLHEALFQQEVEGKDSGTVVVVSKIGYKLHDRVIRPALVGVSK